MIKTKNVLIHDSKLSPIYRLKGSITLKAFDDLEKVYALDILSLKHQLMPSYVHCNTD